MHPLPDGTLRIAWIITIGLTDVCGETMESTI